MRGRAEQAFTLVELVIVIAIVGILAAIAIPRFIDIRKEAYASQRDGIIGAVRAGILTTAAKNQVNQGTPQTFPPNLEATWVNGSSTITGGTLEAAATACSPAAKACFELVIPGGYLDLNWQQLTATGSQYKFTDPTVTGTQTCTYDNTTGTFLCS